MQIQLARNVLALLSTLTFGVCAHAQTTWFVDVQAAPGGNGTASAPFSTLQDGILAGTTVNGDILSVAPGVYTENIRLHGKTITLRSTGGPTVTTLRAAASGPVAWLDATGCYLEGFTISGAFNGPGILIPVAGQGNGWIRRCIVTGNMGLGIEHNYDAQIQNCTIYGNGGAGMVMGPLAALTMSNTIVWGNGAPAGDFTGFPTTVEWCVLDNGFCPHCDNLHVDPWLWNPLLGDLRPRPGSPCVDGGDPTSALDPDGSRRDIGALVFEPAYIPPPQRYCTSKVNSLGCTPAISWTGLPSISGGAFTLHCSQVLNQRSGLLFYGFAPHFLAFQGGFLCVLPPTVRTPVTNSGGNAAPPDDCSGVHSFDFGARIQSGLDPHLTAGTMTYAQFWYRDPASSFQSGRSDAVSFGIRP
jgi:hypothetical protein